MDNTMPLVLLHGWAFDRRIWNDLLPVLQARGRSVIAVDLPCFGDSTLCSDDLRAVSEYVLARMPERAVVLGWSLGGMLATYLAMHHPKRIAAYITVGSNLKWVAEGDWPGSAPDNFSSFVNSVQRDARATLPHFCALIARGDQQEKKLARLLRHAISHEDVDRLWCGLRLLDAMDNRPGFSTLSVPGLHLFGDRDALVPASLAHRILALNPQQQVRVLEGCAHAPFLTDPQAFVDAVEMFIAALYRRQQKMHVARSFSQAASTYDQAALLQREIGDRLLERITLRDPAVVLDLGCGTGHYSRALKQRYPAACVIGLDIAPGMLREARQHDQALAAVCADGESLPFAAHSVDLVYSNVAIQWCEDLACLFAEIRRVLKPNGQVLLSTFIGNTLCELKQAWATVDGEAHVNAFTCPETLLHIAAGQGLQGESLQEWTRVRHYSAVREVSAELKAIGAHHVNSGRARGLTGKQKWHAVQQAYESFRQAQGLPATYHVFFMGFSLRGD